jgi:hypothetical protein
MGPRTSVLQQIKTAMSQMLIARFCCSWACNSIVLRRQLNISIVGARLSSPNRGAARRAIMRVTIAVNSQFIYCEREDHERATNNDQKNRHG